VETEDDADIVLTLAPKKNRCTEAERGNVYCYVTATVSVLNTRTKKTLKPNIGEVKGGWTQQNYDKAEEVAFGELAKELTQKVLPYFKN
jgi:hypothetical protein